MTKLVFNGYKRISKKAAEKLYNDGFNTTLARNKEFETVVNAFTFYNCNNETGRYPAYYVKM